MKSQLLSGVGLVLLSLVCSCQRGVTPQEYQAIKAWLTCEDCMGGEQAAVAAIGSPALPFLRDALLLDSLPGDRRDLMRRNFAQGYRAVAGLVPDSAEYVDGLLANYDAGIRKRATISLGDLDGQGINGVRGLLRSALDSSGVKGFRYDVVGELIGAVGGFGGTGTANVQVLNTAPAAVEGATVTARTCSQAQGAQSPPDPGNCVEYSGDTSNATSDAAGSAEFPGVAEGIHEVSVDPFSVGYANSVPDSRLYLLAGDGDVESGDFTLEPFPLPPPGAFAGIYGAVSADLEGISGADVFLSGTASGTTVTDLEGAYSFENLGSGVFTVAIELPETEELETVSGVFRVLGTEEEEISEGKLGLTYPTSQGAITLWYHEFVNPTEPELVAVDSILGRIDFSNGDGSLLTSTAAFNAAIGDADGNGTVDDLDALPLEVVANLALSQGYDPTVALGPPSSFASYAFGGWSPIAAPWPDANIDLFTIVDDAVANYVVEHVGDSSVDAFVLDEVWLVVYDGGASPHPTFQVCVVKDGTDHVYTDNGINRFYTFTFPYPTTGPCAVANLPTGASIHGFGVKGTGILVTNDFTIVPNP